MRSFQLRPYFPILLYQLTVTLLWPSECFIFRNHDLWTPTALRQASSFSLGGSSDNADKDSTAEDNANLDWLRDAMNMPSPMEPDGLVMVKAQPGVAGFAVDPDRGFVVVLVGDEASNNDDRATYAVISPKDKQRVRSPEALTLVQLAGGLDLGTPVLPPDILAKLVADEMNGEEVSSPAMVRDLRDKVKLRRVDVVAHDGIAEDETNLDDDEPTSSTAATPITLSSSSPKRDAVIEEQSAKVTASVIRLPGLEDCTAEQVEQAMQARGSHRPLPPLRPSRRAGHGLQQIPV